MLAPLLEVTRDLSADLAADERYQRLVTVARQMIPCDAIALLRLEGDTLVPVVVDGLRGEAVARRFVTSEHPRLARILAARGPIRSMTTRPIPSTGCSPIAATFARARTRAWAHR